jgi:1,4-dihydroxy-2-naphthoate octaprenyltransferase
MVEATEVLPRRQLWTRLLLYPGHTLPTAAAPVLVGVGLAWRDGVFSGWPALLFLLGSWLVHVAGVFADQYTLIRDHPALREHPELLDALAHRTLALSTLATAIGLCLGLAMLFGAVLLWLSGPWVLVIGLVGILSSLGYHWGPWSYAKRGLADPVFFVMFGAVAVAATYLVQAAALPSPANWWQRTAHLPWAAWWVGLPVGALVTSVLVIDDIRDRHWDAQKGWRTPAVRWGLHFSRVEFAVLVALAYAAPPGMWVLGWGVGALLPLLTAPLAWQALQAVGHHADTQALLPWTPKVARLGLIYATLQAVGLALPMA